LEYRVAFEEIRVQRHQLASWNVLFDVFFLFFVWNSETLKLHREGQTFTNVSVCIEPLVKIMQTVRRRKFTILLHTKESWMENLKKKNIIGEESVKIGLKDERRRLDK
jgi:hypothetical protein